MKFLKLISFFQIIFCILSQQTVLEKVVKKIDPKNLTAKKDPYLAKITKLVAISIKIGINYLEKPIIIGLFGDDVPKSVENFYQLCTKHDMEISGLKLTYLNSIFHRVLPGFLIQGGDITRGNGRGGWSIYGSEFEDENFDIAHDIGVVAYANFGKDTNNSQFFITTEKNEKFNDKYVVFGIVVKNMDIVYLIENYGDKEGIPKEDIVIDDCYDPTLVE